MLADTDEENIQMLDGLFVGQLDEEELALFEIAIKDGKAARSYEGVAGFLGLAKVRITS
jgi:hypothetical protein